MITMCSLSVTLGYEMTRDECEEMMRECDATWDDFDSEEEAFREMTEYKLGCGLGCNAEVLSAYGD